MTQRGAGKGEPVWWVRLFDWWHHGPSTHWWADWHYTDGWGSFGTIVVAVLAILVSAWYNRRTLRQSQVLGAASITVTRQQRADLRYDVLRKELAQWLTMVSQVETVCGELLRRLQNVDPNTDFGGSPLFHVVDVGGPSVGGLHSIIGQALAEPMTNLNSQTIQIQMLTADYSVLVNVHFITQAIYGKVQGLYALLEKAKRSAGASPHESTGREPYYLTAMMAMMQDYQYTRQIVWSRTDLMAHIIRRFNPAAVGALERVYREHPDVIGDLQPTNIMTREDIFGPETTPEEQDANTEPIATQPNEAHINEADTEPIG
ncbi:hypothetical protein D8S82_15145 [Mycobacterium hodleri]|uniref:Uncharacterized protein n=1 Tax=Mycolicibacterium hodleri TaxID=49897 RepID=A0A544W0A3_9MYCO|nr:hypothetical protein [Mycolicibacterium hodleri]TQR85671.1 hypothetical protein D8S82_15145 [Mycolicibacterium hodleri]